MTTLKLKHVELGAILSNDAKDVNGRMLLSAGSEIKEKHLKIFKTWGITEVSIVGDDHLEGDIEIDLFNVEPALLNKIEQDINNLFILSNNEHPANHELREYLILKKVKEHLS
ncbi:MAG: hypothetical protein JKY76_05555 [Proteobacteria bacterium]|nr:hypothetical protein [Pseudomonadota bacterium]